MAGKEDKSAKSGAGMQKILIAGGALVLVVLGVFAGPMITSALSGSPAETAAAEGAPAEAGKSALYTSLHPPLVISFKDSDGDNHYMQMTIDVMARDQKVIDAVKQHTPVIRNALILLYGNVDRDAVGSRAGKEKMLADALTEIQNVMTRQTGSAGVEAVYFTSLIVQ